VNEERQILLVTTRNDFSADLLIAELGRRGAPCVRWNLEDFPIQSQLTWRPETGAALLKSGAQTHPWNAFKSAWYRRTAPPRLPAELAPGGMTDFAIKEIAVFLEGVWDTTECFWVNPPARVRAAENKLWQLATAKGIGFAIPRTVVTNDPSAVCELVRSVPAAIAKAISCSGTEFEGETWSLFTRPVTETDLQPQMAIRVAPCIFQERIERKSDIRVTVVGSRLYSAEITIRGERAVGETDWRAVDSKHLAYEPHTLPVKLAELCQSMLRQLGLKYGCFDFLRTTDDRYVFLEINPSGQWGWIEHEVGAPITKALAELLIEAEV